MIAHLANWLENRLNLRSDQIEVYLQRLVITLAATVFVLLSTLIVASVDLFPSQGGVDQLKEGEVSTRDVFAPRSITYNSAILTQQRRDEAEANVTPIYNAPDPDVARQQTQLARQILDYMENVRQDTLAERAQKIQDMHYITALDLDETTISQILDVDQDTWSTIDTEIITVLERVMRGQIQETDLRRIRDQLPTQVSVRFDEREVSIIVAIVDDLIRSNTTINEEATAVQQENAVAAVTNVPRSFERGQIVIASGQRIQDVDIEALTELGLLQPSERRTESIIVALIASIIVLVVVGLYAARFNPTLLYYQPRMLTILSAIFLIVLFGARIGLVGQFYLYPTAALSLLYVAIIGPNIAIIGTLALSFLISLMIGNSLEIATLVTVGGLIGLLTLRRTERLNSFFLAGLMVSSGNIAVVALFNLPSALEGSSDLAINLLYVFFNGLFAAAAALAGLYVVSLLFNLPTALKLAELSQPGNALLQRLLREAPGTYQHSLQVANLSEQAATAIGADAQLAHVAALYHDIGKMLNPAFFIENQRYIGNPHDTLNDPYRSADIIISHVTGGDDMARQYHLPVRIRDFIREHHGTSTVYYFYKQAVIQAGDDESLIDKSEFTYPGPRPRSRETAILMLADSSEASVRAIQPKTRQEIEQTIHNVIDGKRKEGQLDESGLTLKDLKTIETIFVDMMQAIFHPRINYSDAISKVRQSVTENKEKAVAPTPTTTTEVPKRQAEMTAEHQRVELPPAPKTETADTPLKTPVVVRDDEEDDDSPLAEVPRLRKSNGSQSTTTSENSVVNNNGASGETHPESEDDRITE